MASLKPRSSEEILSAFRPFSAEEVHTEKYWPELHLDAASWIEGDQSGILETQPSDAEASPGGRDLEEACQPPNMKDMDSESPAQGLAVAEHQCRSDDADSSPLGPQQTVGKKLSDGEAFGQSSKLMTEQDHHANGVHLCDRCGKDFQWVSHLERHQRSHPGRKATRWSYRSGQHLSEGSSPISSSPLQVENLLESSCDMGDQKAMLRPGQNNPTNDQCICDHCGRNFRWPSHLARHHKLVQSWSKAAGQGKKQVEVDTPNPTVPVPEPQQVENTFHQKLTLMTDQSMQTQCLHICVHCGKEFQWPSDLAQHHLVHQDQEPKSCSPCPLVPAAVTLEGENTSTGSSEMFCQTSPPKIDQSIQTKDPHHCDSREKDFQGPSAFAQHQHVHSGGKVAHQGLFQLEECSSHPLVPAPLQAGTTLEKSGKALWQNSKLMTDQSTHPKNLHHCSLCGRNFRWPSALARHHRYMHSMGNPARQGRCPSEAYSPWVPLSVPQEAEDTFADSCENPRQESMLATDQSTCTKDLHACDQCGMDFQWPSELAQHHLVHSGGGQGRDSQCPSKVDGLDPLTPSSAALQVDRSKHPAKHSRRFKKSYTCGQCRKSFRWPSDFARHKHTHSRGKLRRSQGSGLKTSYICGECGKSFDYPSNLARHERTHSRKKLERGEHSPFKVSFICGECGKPFQYSSSLAQHELSHHIRGELNRAPMPSDPATTNQSAQFKEQCGQGFQQLSDFTQDEYTHSGQRPHGCALCGCRFRRYVQLRKHQIMRHEKNYEGEEDEGGWSPHHESDEDVSTENTPAQQLQRLPALDSREYCKCLASPKACECGQCHTETNDSSELLPLSRIWGTGISSHPQILSLLQTCECGFCGTDDSSSAVQPVAPSPLKVKITASAELASPWHLLETVINSPSDLSASSAAHESVVYVMKEKASPASSTTTWVRCPPAMASQSPVGCRSLSSPVWFMEQASPLVGERKPYACPMCPKRFSLTSYLTKHLHIHQEGKPYSCATCNKCFSQRSYLTKHQKLHTTRLAYECSDCGSLFTQLSYLRKHVRIHQS